MALFKKENCCLCGGKTGMLDKKTASGKVCKACRSSLSVWFDDYKKSTAEDLRAQLAQKEADMEKARTLNYVRVFGDLDVILIDEEARVFSVVKVPDENAFGKRRKISSFEDVMDLRPDLISFDQVVDLDIDIHESTHETQRTVNGEQVSYDPPHFVYMESFALRIKVDHPYISTVSVRLNHDSIHIRHVGRRKKSGLGTKLAAYLMDLPDLPEEKRAAVYDNDSLIDWFYHSDSERPKASYGFNVTIENWEAIKKYQYYLVMAREIQRMITGGI